MTEEFIGDHLCKHLRSIGVEASPLQIDASDVELWETLGVDVSSTGDRATKIKVEGTNLSFIITYGEGKSPHYVIVLPETVEWPPDEKGVSFAAEPRIFKSYGRQVDVQWEGGELAERLNQDAALRQELRALGEEMSKLPEIVPLGTFGRESRVVAVVLQTEYYLPSRALFDCYNKIAGHTREVYSRPYQTQVKRRIREYREYKPGAEIPRTGRYAPWRWPENKALWVIPAFLVIAPIVVGEVFFKTRVATPTPSGTVFSDSSGDYWFGIFLIWIAGLLLCLFMWARFQRGVKKRANMVAIAICLGVLCGGVFQFAANEMQTIIIDKSLGTLTVETGSLLGSKRSAIGLDQIDHIELTWEIQATTTPSVAMEVAHVEVVRLGQIRLQVVERKNYEWSHSIATSIAEASGKPLYIREGLVR